MGVPNSQKLTGQGAMTPAAAAQGLRLRAPIHLRTARTNCWKCHQDTLVQALIAADVQDMGESGQARSYVHGIIEPPHELLSSLRLLAPHLRLGPVDPDGHARLCNHCEHCGAVQSDVYLFGEAAGPFFGRPPEGRLGALLIEHDLAVRDAEYFP